MYWNGIPSDLCVAYTITVSLYTTYVALTKNQTDAHSKQQAVWWQIIINKSWEQCFHGTFLPVLPTANQLFVCVCVSVCMCFFLSSGIFLLEHFHMENSSHVAAEQMYFCVLVWPYSFMSTCRAICSYTLFACAYHHLLYSQHNLVFFSCRTLRWCSNQSRTRCLQLNPRWENTHIINKSLNI